MMNMDSFGSIRNNTPWEQHGDIWVKREDLCCPEGPQFSKIRGLVEHLSKLPSGKLVGVLDTVHSKGGWGAAYVCAALGLPCRVFYPGMGPRNGQIEAAKWGAELFSLKPGRSSVLWYRARNLIGQDDGYMLPNGLQLQESIEATRREVEDFTPPELKCGTWVVSASTGTIAQGVSQGLDGAVHLIVHLGYSRSVATMKKKFPEETEFIDEGYGYRDAAGISCPFPCNPYYDLKAWKWLGENIDGLEKPIIFWNIGA